MRRDRNASRWESQGAIMLFFTFLNLILWAALFAGVIWLVNIGGACQ